MKQLKAINIIANDIFLGADYEDFKNYIGGVVVDEDDKFKHYLFIKED
jgi:hypothetical protein